MRTLPIRLHPLDDLREAIASVLKEHGVEAAFVLSGIGSLGEARIRYAGVSEATLLRGDLEILTLSGSVAPSGVHLHMTVSDAQGKVIGGHVAPGCTIRTTAEILLALLPDYRFSREPDPQSGWDELVVRTLTPPGKARVPSGRG
ncbi:PPC domain-containing DNA-binding protein [Massilia sp. CFBP9012]|uniref:PPC domain-containing DNA-binding protein n=1 Tax=Massilia sp. CFBP9012 TaxID=3096531 RepID=UPI002A6B178A|nr:PPC domain-containing DNA-binding protein [Massilia sp. CFBP9012]MDY0977684.1 PPC domain-containing DNA-binding protein [Massilia sp. CFBP9012]